jgi:uncharacterized protein (TIGR02646 family)
MKYISKSAEPEVFRRWKAGANEDWQPSYDELAVPEKQAVRLSLLAEQGHLCCYCGQRVGVNDSHIEHLEPQSVAPDRALAYDNLLLSCGRDRWGVPLERPRGDKIKRPHCGRARGNELLPVTPLQPDCGQHFQFVSDGAAVRIRPAGDADQQQRAARTIELLVLDHIVLDRNRAAALALFLDEWRAGSVDGSSLARLMEPQTNGHLWEFCFAVVSVLTGRPAA